MTLFSVQPNGLITVDSSEIKQSFENAYKDTFGANLNTEAGTIQGQMIITDTKMMTYAQNQCALVANAFSVLTAKGSALDVAAAFWGYYRKSGQKTVVNATITGLSGTVIQAGALAGNGDHNFALLDTVTIPITGSTNAQFQAVDSGSISCVAGSLTEIISAQSGWDSISNSADGILGYETESDNQFRQRITANWFNIRARGELGSIMDNLAQLDGVLTVLVRENPTNYPLTIDGYTLVAHSIYVAIVGGNNSDIAKVLFDQKASGSATNGEIDCTYQDTYTGVNNTYKIVRPDFVNIALEVKYSNNYYTPVDVEDKIKNLILQYINDNSFSIGQVVSGYDLARAFVGFEYANLISIKVAVYDAENEMTYTDYIDTTIEEIAVLSAENISCVQVTGV